MKALLALIALALFACAIPTEASAQLGIFRARNRIDVAPNGAISARGRQGVAAAAAIGSNRVAVVAPVRQQVIVQRQHFVQPVVVRPFVQPLVVQQFAHPGYVQPLVLGVSAGPACYGF